MRIATISPSRLCIILVFLSIAPNANGANAILAARTPIAQTVADGASHLGFHKVYVPDFCDSNSRPDGPGAYFAAGFSYLLEHNAKDFSVVSRVDAHRFLLENHWTDCDLTRREVVQKFVDAMGADAFLTGSVTSEKDYFHVDLVLRDASGKERIHCVYDERYYPETIGSFPASASSAGWPFYFALLDGVTFPKPVKTPGPAYPNYKVVRLSGTVVISMMITTDGSVEEARVVQRMDPDIDGDMLKMVKNWQFEPAKGADGKAVPTRLVMRFQLGARAAPGIRPQAQYPEDRPHP